MRKLLRRFLIFAAGVSVGVIAMLGWQKFTADWDADIGGQLKAQFDPVASVSVQFFKFCEEKDRPPKDAQELAAFAKTVVTNELDLSKFSELRFVSISNRTAAMIWHLAPPFTASGTNGDSWQRD